MVYKWYIRPIGGLFETTIEIVMSHTALHSTALSATPFFLHGRRRMCPVLPLDVFRNSSQFQHPKKQHPPIWKKIKCSEYRYKKYENIYIYTRILCACASLLIIVKTKKLKVPKNGDLQSFLPKKLLNASSSYHHQRWINHLLVLQSIGIIFSHS